MKKFLFISYSHQNTPIVLSVVRKMQSDGYLVWMDRRLQGGSRWSDEIARRIRECNCCILFISHSYIQSANCEDEWSYAKKCGKTILRIHLDDIILPDGMDMQLGRYQFLTYDTTNLFWNRLYESLGVIECKNNGNNSEENMFSLNDEIHTRSFEKDIRGMIQWLISLTTKWGALDSSMEAQHANTCEGLLAMKLSGYDIIRKNTYMRIWNSLCQEMTEKGLSSKSLGRETVVCTSMLLLLAAMEREQLTIEMVEKFDNMARYLWNIRNDEYGWGVFLSRSSEDSCSFANTAWALRALREYREIREEEEFDSFCHLMFEYEQDGAFPYYIGGQSKLITTAMFLGLYYRMDDKWKKEQDEVFSIQNSIQFVYNAFVGRNTQVEQETLYGIDVEGSGPTKVPWNHITVWAAIDALSQAYYNNDLDKNKWGSFLLHIERIIEENVCHLGNKAYYQPQGLDESRKGHYTFPTAYFIMGLSQMIVMDV